ncbi:MAG: hypothetical protein HOW73_18290 [Polyangiaceae bacterium]|nr:hypothetical protein [Polyangiaceae bacterium]
MDDERDTRSLLKTTDELLSSHAFRNNVSKLNGAFPSLWLSPVGATVTPDEALAAFLGTDGRYGMVATTLVWGAERTTGDAPGHSGEAQIELGRDVLSLWRSDERVAKSCAVNSLVHEMTHTVTSDKSRYTQLFRDRGRSTHDVPLVSYVLGAAAQCTYLQAPDIVECVRKWGTNIFKSGDCRK